MKTKSKIIIAVGTALLAAAVLVALGLVVLGVYVASDQEGAKQYREALAEGPKFGKTTDQEGCVREGFARLAGVPQPSVSQLSANDRFVRECFGASRPSPGFCDGVPLFPYGEWVTQKCAEAGKADAVCRGVMDAKHTYCNGL